MHVLLFVIYHIMHHIAFYFVVKTFSEQRVLFKGRNNTLYTAFKRILRTKITQLTGNNLISFVENYAQCIDFTWYWYTFDNLRQVSGFLRVLWGIRFPAPIKATTLDIAEILLNP